MEVSKLKKNQKTNKDIEAKVDKTYMLDSIKITMK